MIPAPEDVVSWISKYALAANKKALVVGISGGIDSSLVSTLCAMTGLKTVILRLPIHQIKKQDDLSIDHAEWLLSNYSKNVVSITKDLTSTFDSFCSSLSDDETSDLSLANARSRLRMMMLYQIASTSNGIVVGTGNKVEDFGIGFFTKYGDGGVDISPIADLYKSEVKQMAMSLGVLDSIVTAPPTDGLWDDGRTDEDQIGATYNELERAMQHPNNEPVNDREREVLEIYNKFHRSNKHKMVPIPVFERDS